MGKVIYPLVSGVVATIALLALYFGILTLVSGWPYTLEQFADFWYFVVSLAVGFGLQVGLYSYLRSILNNKTSSGKVVAVSGTTSAAAMVSCCAHYLVYALPVLGATGIISFVGQYQVEFFWFGLVANIAGIVYMFNQIIKVNRL